MTLQMLAGSKESESFQKAFRFFKIYNALRLHYTEGSGYDYFKYNGVTRTTEKSFETSPHAMKFVALSQQIDPQEVVQFLNWTYIDGRQYSGKIEIPWIGNLRGLVGHWNRHKVEVLDNPDFLLEQLKRWYPKSTKKEFLDSFRGHSPDALSKFLVNKDMPAMFFHSLDDAISIYREMERSHKDTDFNWPVIYSLMRNSKFMRFRNHNRNLQTLQQYFT